MPCHIESTQIGLLVWVAVHPIKEGMPCTSQSAENAIHHGV